MNLSMIEHPDFGCVRTQMIKGEPWFVAKDVCEVLGIDKHRDVVARLDDEDKGRPLLVDTLGGKQEMTTINESGLYNLIFQSRKPAARKFKRWVTPEVLPAIRRQGYYIHPESADRKQLKRLNADMHQLIDRYVTADDEVKVCRKFGINKWDLGSILRGGSRNNAIMQELQRRAMVNKGAEVDAYAPERMQKIIQKLSL